MRGKNLTYPKWTYKSAIAAKKMLALILSFFTCFIDVFPY